MIKKIMAMLVAISCAFGAWADTHINGTDFSGLATGPFTVGLDDGGQTGTTYWYNGATNDFDGTIVAEGGKNFLTFESSITNPLYRTFKSCDGATSTSALNPTNIGNGLFIDTTVQFTPYLVNDQHEAPSALSSDDKLIIWVCETESTNNVPNTTNLIVTARYLGSGGSTIVSNYVVTTIGENELDSATVSGLCSHTNRLTIKAFETITTNPDATIAGFVVYLNKEPLGYTGDAIAADSSFKDLKPAPGYWYGRRQLFPSLMPWNASGNKGQLSGVGYAGMGKIGDVFLDDYLTDYPDFAGDGHNFTVVLGDGVTSFVYNNVVYSNNYASSVELAVDSVTISNVTYDADHGWKHKNDTWRNENDTVVSNRVDASGKDYGTFYFADGAIFTLIGFQANYIVNGTEYDDLSVALHEAITGGYALVLNNNIVLDDVITCLMVNEGETLVLDLNGYTIQGTTDSFGTIANLDGTLTVIDTSLAQTGKVLPSTETGISLYAYNGSTTLNAGEYGLIRFIEDDSDDGSLTAVINGGTYYDPDYNPDPEDSEEEPVTTFYLERYLGEGKEVIDWNQVGDDWYATVGEPSGDRWDITFSTNNVVVTEWNLTVNAGDPIGNHIPNFTGGSWDAPAPTAETVVTSDTNFNYTIPYTLTYVTAHGVAPDGATYTNGAPNFALAAAPTADGWQFNGWLIGSDVFDAGDPFVVADHLEDTTATAVWAPISYTLTYATDKGTAPDAVSYTVESNNFTLADGPEPGVVGIQFAGWVIGSVTNAAGATYVVADHLENTTATAAWAPVVPTGTAIYLVMGSGVDSISTSFNGTDWTAYTDALQDVELGSTLYIKGASSVTGYDVPQFSIVVDDTHATEQTALVVNKSAIVYFPQTAIEQEWADRNGTAAKPFVIRNYADLVALKNGVANGTITNQCFEQVADIDMAGTGTWDCIGERDRDTSKGNFDNTFKGTYDGGCHVVSNVTFASVKYAGLFGSTYGATIKDLTVNVVGIDGSGSSYGCAAVVGTAVNSTLSGVTATGTIRTTAGVQCNHNVGGIAVRFEGSTAYGCTNKCEIWTLKEKVGGIAAFGQSDAENFFTLCSNEGAIHCSKTGSITDGGVGGIFGWQGSSGAKYQKATYTDCRSIAVIDSQTDDMTGSILGKSADVSSASVPDISGTTVVRDDLRVIYNYRTGDDYGKSIGGGLVELCTQAAFETNNTYSTMWSGLTPTFAFEAAGTISFNTNLFQATAFAITGPQGYEVTSSEAGGIVTFTCAIPGPADPWAPTEQTDAAASNKVVEIFGEGSDVANHVTTLAEYGELVAYITNVTSEATVPSDLTGAQKSWMWKSFILGANPLFDADVAVEITSLTANSEAGKWDFTVKVTEGESTDAYNVAADKVGALVKIRTSLTTGTWVTPTAGNIEAIKLLGGNLIKVTVNFGDGASGFMKVSEE